MSMSDFFAKVRAGAVKIAHDSQPTQYELALKAMFMLAEGQRRQKRAPRGMYLSERRQIGETTHRNGKVVPLYYQTKLDASRYPIAHEGNNAVARRLRQIAAGSLRAENGLVH